MCVWSRTRDIPLLSMLFDLLLHNGLHCVQHGVLCAARAVLLLNLLGGCSTLGWCLLQELLLCSNPGAELCVCMPLQAVCACAGPRSSCGWVSDCVPFRGAPRRPALQLSALPVSKHCCVLFVMLRVLLRKQAGECCIPAGMHVVG